jgi:hypothetical protein
VDPRDYEGLLDPALEARVDQEARRLGLTKSEFVKDTLQRVLGLKSPARRIPIRLLSHPDAMKQAAKSKRANTGKACALFRISSSFSVMFYFSI